MQPLDRYERAFRCCEHCGRLGRLGVAERLAQLLDEGSRRDLDEGSVPHTDPLGFIDTAPYRDRVRTMRDNLGMHDAVSCATGTIDGHPLVVAVSDFNFLGGSLGQVAGEMITRAAEEALRTRQPLLVVNASGGARMQEGTLALMQMAKTSAAIHRLNEAGVPTFSMITDPTFGGVAASVAALAEVIIAEPGARMGFAGRRVIEQTTRETLPDKFQEAEFLLDHGLIDAIVPRAEVRGFLARLLRMLNGEAAGAHRSPDTATHAVDTASPWEMVQRARELSRPATQDFIDAVFDDFVELRGDRMGNDDPAIVGGLATLAGRPVLVVGHQKGRTVAELRRTGFGMASPHGYRKAARLMVIAARLGIPLVTLIDTPGADPSVNSERRGQAWAIAENLRLMAGLPIPSLALIIGEGGSGGALALGVTNRVLALSSAVYSVISPEGCAAILWRDAGQAETAANLLRVDSRSGAELGVIDRVVSEAGKDFLEVAAGVKKALVEELHALDALTAPELVSDRFERFRGFVGIGEEI
ncbi:acetyl-coenzyme A carboxylase carboxyl transferase subunits beta/alpha [Enemella evansiae]|uniref:acetyl-coenzyme A carboxylase carboxyl transferase subunits beta/alpha n=1 Tax=Enemella evansiae TaxID=2016499 RepID=UPI001594FDD7|nr:carboxyl transferase domain-containing protein [Enemella evansiae]